MLLRLIALLRFCALLRCVVRFYAFLRCALLHFSSLHCFCALLRLFCAALLCFAAPRSPSALLCFSASAIYCASALLRFIVLLRFCASRLLRFSALLRFCASRLLRFIALLRFAASPLDTPGLQPKSPCNAFWMYPPIHKHGTSQGFLEDNFQEPSGWTWIPVQKKTRNSSRTQTNSTEDEGTRAARPRTPQAPQKIVKRRFVRKEFLSFREFFQD